MSEERILPYIGMKVICKDCANSFCRENYIELEILQTSPSLYWTKIKYPSSSEKWIKTEELFSTDMFEGYKILECLDYKKDIIEEETEFQKARRIMRETLFFKDEGLYISYQANVAMLLCDEQRRRERLINFEEEEVRNEIANKILKLIFSKEKGGIL
jgi:hypothetical protein